MQRQTGFTLIEMLITMVVLAVLAAIAVPNYTEYVRRGKLPEGTSNLLAMRVKMEQYFQDNRSYPTGGCVQSPTAPGAGEIQVPKLEHFTIDCNNPKPTANTYKIWATGGVSGGDQGVAGIVYSIDQANVRTTTVNSGTAMYTAGYAQPSPNNCWVTKKPNLC